MQVDAKTKLKLRLAPSFVLKPTDIVADAGSAVVFDCTANGSPTPRIRKFFVSMKTTLGVFHFKAHQSDLRALLSLVSHGKDGASVDMDLLGRV